SMQAYTVINNTNQDFDVVIKFSLDGYQRECDREQPIYVPKKSTQKTPFRSGKDRRGEKIFNVEIRSPKIGNNHITFVEVKLNRLNLLATVRDLLTITINPKNEISVTKFDRATSSDQLLDIKPGDIIVHSQGVDIPEAPPAPMPAGMAGKL